MIRYVVTAIKTSGLRELAFDNNGLNSFTEEVQATKLMTDVTMLNSPERVLELVGKDLKVLPVECHASGDAKHIYFDI